jgi:hypothetical protein
MGFIIKQVPDSTFYLWLDLEGLPDAISDGLFDSPCHHFVRFSYGPKMETLKMGLDGIERVVKK